MIPAEIAGALMLAVPALVAAWIALRRQGMALFLFAAALIVVGVGLSDADRRDGGHRAAACFPAWCRLR